MKSERECRQDIVEVCRRMHGRGFISGSDGNVSVRLGANRILSTPSGLNKGFIAPRDLIVTDMDGTKLQGEHKPTTELFMHIEAYTRREDVGTEGYGPVATICTSSRFHPQYCHELSVAPMVQRI